MAWKSLPERPRSSASSTWSSVAGTAWVASVSGRDNAATRGRFGVGLPQATRKDSDAILVRRMRISDIIDLDPGLLLPAPALLSAITAVLEVILTTDRATARLTLRMSRALPRLRARRLHSFVGPPAEPDERPQREGREP